MSGPRRHPDDLLVRARELAGSGEWRDLVELLEGIDRETLLADSRLAYLHGQGLYFTGRMEELRSFAETFEAEARSRADAAATMRALNLAGNTAFELGEPERAERRYEELMDLAEAEGDREMQANAANNLGALANRRGRPEEALAYYRLAAPLYERLGETRGLAQMHHNIAISYRDKGWLRDAQEFYREAQRLADGIGYQPLVAMSTAGRAELEVRREDPAVARELAERALAIAGDVGDPVTQGDALRVLGLATAGDDPTAVGRALEHVERAADLGRESSNRLLEAEATRDAGRLLMEAGETEEGRKRLRRALALFESIGAELESGRIREELSAAS